MTRRQGLFLGMNRISVSAEDVATQPKLRELVLYFLRLGAFGFGGPIALVGYMQRDLVEDKKWVSREDYFEGLAFSQLCPGPLAAQLAKYLGWVHSGTLGASLTGLAFILPSFLMVLGLASLYVHFGQLAWIQGLFYGIGAAVSAIIVRSAWKLIQKTLGTDYLLWVLFAALAFTTVWTQSEIVWLFLLSGFVAMFVKARPKCRSRPGPDLRSLLERLHCGISSGWERPVSKTRGFSCTEDGSQSCRR